MHPSSSGLGHHPFTVVTPVRIRLGVPINTSMKDLLRMLPQILGSMPEIVKYLKYIPILMLLGCIGFGVFYYMENHKDPYICVNNQVFEQLRVDSDVYVFRGETCVDAKDVRE